MELIEWIRNYNNKKIIDVKSELTEEEIKIAKKICVYIKDKIYTESEYDELKEELGMYYAEKSYNKKLTYFRKPMLSVKDQELDKLISKFNQIENKYEKIINKIKFRYVLSKPIEYKERITVRDNFIEIIEKDNLKSEQKKIFFEIIMNMNNVILRQRERSVIYYGLNCEKEKVHNFTKISKIQNCSPSTIRQAVGNVSRKIVRLPTKEIIILKEMIEDYNKEI